MSYKNNTYPPHHIIILNKHEHREIMLGKTPASVSAVFKELTQHPPHTLFDMWNLFFDHHRCVLGTLSPHEVVHNFSTACYARYLSKINFQKQNKEK